MTAPPVTVRPTVQDVARLLRARTKDSRGAELGTFTLDTRPTDMAVADLIIMAEGDLLAQTGSYLSEQQAAAVESMITLRTAMFVELSYFPEQVNSDRSAYQEYKRLYDDSLASLLAELEGGGGGGGGDADLWHYGSIPVKSWTTTGRYDFAAAETAPLPPPVADSLASALAEERSRHPEQT